MSEARWELVEPRVPPEALPALIEAAAGGLDELELAVAVTFTVSNPTPEVIAAIEEAAALNGLTLARLD